MAHSGYIFYKTNKSINTNIRGRILFRVKVIEHYEVIIFKSNIYCISQTVPNATVWFKCDYGEKIEKCNGVLLEANDFTHINKNKKLLSAIVNSIAPCEVKPGVAVVSSHTYP